MMQILLLFLLILLPSQAGAAVATPTLLTANGDTACTGTSNTASITWASGALVLSFQAA